MDITSTATEIVPLHQFNVALKNSETELSVLKEKFKDVPLDPKNATELAKVETAWREHYHPRLDIEKKVKGTVSDVYSQYKQIKGRGEDIVAAWKAEEDKFKAILNAEEERKKEERKAKAAAEISRINAIRFRIDGIKNLPFDNALSSSTDLILIKNVVEKMQVLESEFQEFFQEALAVRDETLVTLQAMIEAKKQAEALAEQNRLEAERLSKERAEFEAQQQAEREKQAAEAKEAQAKIDAENAKIRAEQRAEAERLSEQQAEINRKAAEFAAKQAEAERIEREKKEAEQAEIEAKKLAEQAAIEAAEHEEKERVWSENEKRAASEYRDWISSMTLLDAIKEISTRSENKTILDICEYQIISHS